MPDQFNLSIDLSGRGRVERMLRSIKDEDFAIDAKCRKDVGVLRLISSLVHFTRVLNSLNNVALDGSDITRLAIAADLASLLIIIVGVGRHCFGDLNIGDLKIVWTLI